MRRGHFFLRVTREALLLSVGFTLLASGPATSLAQELSIKDTSGFTRAAAQVESAGRVQFTIVDQNGLPAEGVEVTLTNPDRSDVRRGNSVAGMVIFEDVGSGTWTVASTAQGITFTDVSILTETAALAGLGSVGAIGGAIVVGGTTAGVLASAAGDDDNDQVLSPAS